MLVAAEFDVTLGFKNLETIQKWLSASQYSYLLNFKFFHLRRKKHGMWISQEKRPVIGWTGDIWKYRSLKIVRPEPGIVLVEIGPGETGSFPPSDFPPLQPYTEQKLAERLIKEQKRKEIREEKRKEMKAKKQSEKGKKDGMAKPSLKRTSKKRKEVQEPERQTTDDLDLFNPEPLVLTQPFPEEILLGTQLTK